MFCSRPTPTGFHIRNKYSNTGLTYDTKSFFRNDASCDENALNIIPAMQEALLTSDAM